MPFSGTRFFLEKSGKFPVLSIWDHPLPGPVSVPPFGSCHFPSQLSPENETGIPKFEILGKFRKKSRNLVLDGNFLLGTEICYISDHQSCLVSSRKKNLGNADLYSLKRYQLSCPEWIFCDNLCYQWKWYFYVMLYAMIILFYIIFNLYYEFYVIMSIL